MLQEAKGRQLLKVSGILMIVFGGITALAMILYLAIVGLIAALAGVDADSVRGFGYFAVLFVFFLLLAAYCIFTGAFGIHRSKMPERSLSCLVMGIIALVLNVCIIVYYLAEDMIGFSLWIFALIALIAIALPTLYIIGAARNWSSYKKGFIQQP